MKYFFRRLSTVAACRMKKCALTRTWLMKFKNIQLTKPDAKQFEPPAGYTEYKDMQKIQQVMMQKIVGTPAK